MALSAISVPNLFGKTQEALTNSSTEAGSVCNQLNYILWSILICFSCEHEYNSSLKCSLDRWVFSLQCVTVMGLLSSNWDLGCRVVLRHSQHNWQVLVSWIRFMGTQCKLWRSGVVWENFGRMKTSCGQLVCVCVSQCPQCNIVMGHVIELQSVVGKVPLFDCITKAVP